MNKQQLYNILFNHSLTRFFLFLSLIIIHTSNHKLISQENFTIVIDPRQIQNIIKKSNAKMTYDNHLFAY